MISLCITLDISCSTRSQGFIRLGYGLRFYPTAPKTSIIFGTAEICNLESTQQFMCLLFFSFLLFNLFCSFQDFINIHT
uniref:Protein CHROMATIN REMODELING 5 n=1 Tax=Rhizophora mucronata TaxID=61149 RepID=A0A2P2MEW8_RHIMU